MTENVGDLNALLGSRICHDLISPLGAIGNGIELLLMSGLSGAPEIALISESVENANARVRFFRIAFGAASDGQMTGRAEIVSILDGITKGGRLTIDWMPTGDCLRSEVKLVFLVLQCFETAMPFGGTVTVKTTDNGWAIKGRAERLKPDQSLWSAFDGDNPGDALNSSTVHFALASTMARLVGRSVQYSFGPTTLDVTL